MSMGDDQHCLAAGTVTMPFLIGVRLNRAACGRRCVLSRGSETALLDCAGSWGFNKVEKKDAVGLGRFEVESNQSPRIGKNDCAMLLGLRETL